MPWCLGTRASTIAMWNHVRSGLVIYTVFFTCFYYWEGIWEGQWPELTFKTLAVAHHKTPACNLGSQTLEMTSRWPWVMSTFPTQTLARFLCKYPGTTSANYCWFDWKCCQFPRTCYYRNNDLESCTPICWLLPNNKLEASRTSSSKLTFCVCISLVHDVWDRNGR